MKWFWLFSLFTAFSFSLAYPNKIGTFSYSEKKDPITDEENRSAIAESIGDGPSAALVLRCTDRKFEVFVMTSQRIGDRRAKAFVRFDYKTPREIDLEVSTNRQGGFLPANFLQWFVQQARGTKRFTVRIFDENQNALTYEFNLEGMPGVEVRLSCIRLLSAPTSFFRAVVAGPVPNTGYVFVSDLQNAFKANVEKMGSGFYFLTINGELDSILTSPRLWHLGIDGFIYNNALMVSLSSLKEIYGCGIAKLDPKTFKVSLRCNSINAVIDYRIWTSWNINSMRPATRTPVRPLQPAKDLNQSSSTAVNIPIDLEAIEICKAEYGVTKEYVGATFEIPPNQDEWKLAQSLTVGITEPKSIAWCRFK